MTIPPRRSSGFTLAELMVALVMSSLVVTSVFYTWTRVSRHLASQKHKSMLETELSSLGKSLASTIRRSQGLVAHDENSLSFVREKDGMKVTCEYREDALYVNDQPVTLIAQSARITGFTVTIEQGENDEQSSGVLLRFTLNAEDDFGNSHVTSHTASLTIVENPGEEDDNWNW